MIRETERAYGGRDAYGQAKAAGKTKLTYGQWVQTRTENFKRWFGDWEAVQHAAVLQGEPVATLSTADAPQGNFADVQEWAAKVFSSQGGKAVRDGFGEVVLDLRAAKTSMAHGGANRYKKVAFAAVKDVIERGALVLSRKDGQEDSFYFSAPVDIDGVTNIETVLVHRDPNTQRMYLHSVTTKENLLNQRVSSADAEASGRSGSTDSEGVASVLRELLNFNPADVSKVVDPQTGEPLVVYHGTPNGEFSVFDAELSGSTVAHPASMTGHFFITDQDAAQMYAMKRRHWSNDPNPWVAHGFLNLRQPNDLGTFSKISELDAALEVNMAPLDREGDGAVANVAGEKVFIAYQGTQIKSATGNIGTFDGGKQDIQFSRAPAADPDGAWQAPQDSQFDTLAYKLQDKQIDTKRVIEAIKAKGKQIADGLNV